MSDLIIKVENLSKKYILNHQRKTKPSTFRESVEWNIDLALKSLRHIFRKDSTLPPTQEEFWALKDVSFEVRAGDRLGIIGRNGSGKSTLLKILSRIVEPTKGKVVTHGRIASLLEIGTGFHAELTGRENIYLNGAILGMSRREIKQKFDEIVAFAEIDKFLDTPVKFYSSGMYVRLAFAVAAHIEPDILIVDEVLAVGDAEFQKKCLGKMKDVSGAGRTILFVSHDIGMVRSICDYGLLLSHGTIESIGGMEETTKAYLENGRSAVGSIEFAKPKDEKIVWFTGISIRSKDQEVALERIDFQEPFCIDFVFESSIPVDVMLGAVILNTEGTVITTFYSDIPSGKIFRVDGICHVRCGVLQNFLRPGKYFISLSLFHRTQHTTYDYKDSVLSFEVSNCSEKDYFNNAQQGVVITRNYSWEEQR